VCFYIGPRLNKRRRGIPLKLTTHQIPPFYQIQQFDLRYSVSGPRAQLIGQRTNYSLLWAVAGSGCSGNSNTILDFTKSSCGKPSISPHNRIDSLPSLQLNVKIFGLLAWRHLRHCCEAAWKASNQFWYHRTLVLSTDCYVQSFHFNRCEFDCWANPWVVFLHSPSIFSHAL
jgi:hypothetical protein